MELDRNPPPNPGEKIFNIRGNPQQIQHAIQMICEKAGLQSDVSIALYFHMMMVCIQQSL